MAVDKKSDYVGNHGGAYVDVDGSTKQFTYIDHDKKTNIGFNFDTPFNKEWETLEKDVKGHPLCEKYLKDNNLDWDSINLGNLREIKKLIDG